MTGREIEKAARKVATPDPDTGGMDVVIRWEDGFTRPVTVYPAGGLQEDNEYMGWVPTKLSDHAWNTYWQPRDVVEVLPAAAHREWAAEDERKAA